jgi:hypothetical protein
VRAVESGCVEDHVGLAQEFGELPVVGRGRDHALARIPGARHVPRQHVAGRWHDASDIRAEITEHACGACRRFAAQINHAHAGEQALRHEHFLSYTDTNVSEGR